MDKDQMALKLFPIILFAVVILVFSNSLQNEFLQGWDDYAYVVNNEAVKGWSIKHTGMAFTSKFIGNYAPVHILSYTLDHSIWGLEAAGFRFSNILIHAVNAVLVFILIFRLCGSGFAAAVSATIFAIHPVQVESVVWISQRKNVLSLLFFLISFLLYLRYTQNGRWSSYAGSLFVFLLSLLTKSVAVVLPVIIIFYHILVEPPGRRKRQFRVVLPYIFLSLILSYVAIKTQAPSMPGGIRGGGIVEYHGGSPYATFLTMIPVLVSYVKMALLPFHLSALYSPTIFTELTWKISVSAIILILLLLSAACSYRYNKLISFWAVWFFICLVPVLQIVPLITIMNDRYLYYPLIGSVAILGHFLSRLFYKTKTTKMRMLFVSCLGVVVLLLCLSTIERNKVWKGSLTFWSDVVKKSPENTTALNNLGAAYMELGLYQDAIQSLNQSIRINADQAAPYGSLGSIFFQLKQFEKAEESIQMAIALEPGKGFLYAILGAINRRQSRYEESWEAFTKAVELDQMFLSSNKIMGTIKQVRETLITQYKKRIEIDSKDVESIFRLGNLYLSMYYDTERAYRMFKQVLRQQPEHIGALNNMASIYIQQKKWNQAEELLQKIITLDQEFESAYLNLGMLYLEMNQNEKGRENLERALKLTNDPLRQKKIRSILRKIK